MGNMTSGRPRLWDGTLQLSAEFLEARAPTGDRGFLGGLLPWTAQDNRRPTKIVVVAALADPEIVVEALRSDERHVVETDDPWAGPSDLYEPLVVIDRGEQFGGSQVGGEPERLVDELARLAESVDAATGRLVVVSRPGPIVETVVILVGAAVAGAAASAKDLGELRKAIAGPINARRARESMDRLNEAVADARDRLASHLTAGLGEHHRPLEVSVSEHAYEFVVRDVSLREDKGAIEITLQDPEDVERSATYLVRLSGRAGFCRLVATHGIDVPQGGR
jgi:hypothetical protein